LGGVVLVNAPAGVNTNFLVRLEGRLRIARHAREDHFAAR
jgi:hypothetical protein